MATFLSPLQLVIYFITDRACSTLSHVTLSDSYNIRAMPVLLTLLLYFSISRAC